MEVSVILYLCMVITLVLQATESESQCLVSPTYISEWTSITSQDEQNSELTFYHGFGELPIKVYAEVKANTGSGEYIFQGYGSAHTDDDSPSTYGGIVYLYNKTEIRVLAPNKNNQHGSGKAFYTGDPQYWLGPEYVALDTVYVRVRAWKRSDMPTPSFESDWYQIDTSNASTTFQEIPHNIGEYPDFSVVQVRGYENHIGEAQGMSNIVQKSEVRSTLGVLYGYSDTAYRIWTPGSSAEKGNSNDCSNQPKYDIVFVVDESTSVGSNNFDKTKEAVKDALGFLNIDTRLMRVGVLCYSTGNRVIFHLHDHDGDLTSALQDVHDIDYKGGGTYIGSAIKSVRENMYLSSNGDRADVENIMILMTDGQSSGHDPYQQVQEAELSKQAGITIATVGIGNNVDDVTLRTLASSNELYLQTDFDNLQRTFEILIESLGSCPSGGVFGAYDGWGENLGVKSITGSFRIVAWQFPESERIFHQNVQFSLPTGLQSTINHDLNFNDQDVIVVNEVHVNDGVNSGFRFQSIGSVLHEGTESKPYGGLIHGYNSNRFVTWTPYTNLNSIHSLLNIGDAWGHGERSQRTNDTDIIFSVWQLKTRASVRCSYTGTDMFSNSNYTLNATYLTSLHFTCQDHHTFQGGNYSITCQQDCTWSGLPLQCQAIRCLEADVIAPHSNVHVTSYNVGGTAFSRCNFGYEKVNGDDIRMCNGTGEWSGDAIVCEKPAECDMTEVVSGFSTVHVTNNSVGGTAFSMCDTDYNIVGGDSVRVCNETGKWTGQKIQCEKACSIPCPSEIGNISSSGLYTVNRKDTVLFKRGLVSVNNNDRTSAFIGATVVAVPVTIVIIIFISDLYRFRMDFYNAPFNYPENK